MTNNAFDKTNLQYIVNYDYERSRCYCNAWETGDYCRCTTITNTWIDEVNANKVIEKLYNKHSKDDSIINKYCFDRICYVHGIYNKDLYEIETGGGYYGEEVYGVYFENEEKIFNDYKLVITFDTDVEKIRYCLKLEYGYLIDCVVSAKSAFISNVSIDRIHLPQREYFVKVDRNVIEEYKDWHLPIAVCIKNEYGYRLIDGYHRYVANKNRSKVDIIVMQ